MTGRYCKAGQVAGQLFIAAVIVAGLVASLALAASLLLGAWLVTA
jgi:hypothetical protein